MKNGIATSIATGTNFSFRYEVFEHGRKTMHSCEIQVAGEWRPACVVVMDEELHGFAEWISGNTRCDVKFIVSPNEDTAQMVEYAKKDAAQYAAEKSAKRQAEINQETFLG
jgi:hypothetical protein